MSHSSPLLWHGGGGGGENSRGRVELDLASAGVCLFLYGHSDEQLGISETAVNI